MAAKGNHGGGKYPEISVKHASWYENSNKSVNDGVAENNENGKAA
jgi:hypothetical protein